MTASLSDIQYNAKKLMEQVSNAVISSGRKPEEVRLMAVTKTNGAERVNEAISSGITLLGENRVQEYLSKYQDYNLSGCDVHFIGHLQTNKVKSIVDKVDMIQSVDRLSLASEIDKCSRLIGKVMPVLVEVNIGREESKSGVLPEQLDDFIAEISDFKNLNIQGLMTIPPNLGNSLEIERYFDEMYRRFIDIKAKKMDNVIMNILSMGMSYDFELAIKHGSSIVRIGRGLFGERQ